MRRYRERGYTIYNRNGEHGFLVSTNSITDKVKYAQKHQAHQKTNLNPDMDDVM